MADAPATRRVVYLTGTRADFGLMASTLARIAATPGVDLKIAVTGMHLSAEHGHTLDEIKATGLTVCAQIELDMGTRSPASMATGMAQCLTGITRYLEEDRPDLLLLLGDRGEMLAGALAALHLGLPCVHIHGGERSGTVDEPMRHAISKLSTYHLVATEESRQRLLRMGEEDSRIFVTGAPGLDGLRELGLIGRHEFLQAVGLPPGAEFILAVFHPVVQQAGQARRQTLALLQALQRIGQPVMWMEPNADAGSLEILRALDKWPLPAGSRRLRHLPRELFVSALRHCELLVGNSSAGIIEAPSFGTPVVNVGDRQRLRERNANVTDAAPQADLIESAVRAALGHGRWPCDNLWGDGRAGERIARLLATLPMSQSVLEKINTY